MFTLKELRAKLQALIQRQEELLQPENPFTTELQAECATIEEEIRTVSESIDKLIAEEEARSAALKALESRKAEVSAIALRAKASPSIEVKKKPFDHILKDILGEDRTFGKYMQCVARQQLDGYDKNFQRIQQETRAATGMNTQNNEDGGYLIGTTDGGFISDKAYEESVFAKRATLARLDPGTRSITYRRYKKRSRLDGYRFGGFTINWEGEGETIEATRLKYELHTLSVSSLKATLVVTNDLLANAAGLESEINTLAPKVFAFEIDRGMFSGTGNGQMLGIMSSASKIAIAKEQSQLATTLVLENIVKMLARSTMGNSVWFANQDVIPALVFLKNLDSSPAFIPLSGGATGSLIGTLFGRPLIFTEFNKTLGAEGDLLLADFSAYRLLDPTALRVEGSMHVYFLSDEYAFRFVKSVGGAPMYDSPITPLEGTGTLSEFVTTAVRA